MLFIFYIFVFLVSIIALGVSSGAVSRSILKLSKIAGVNEHILSFLLIGALTSIPEIFIATASILIGTPLISIGNIIGANFVTITLAIGLVAYISGGIDLSGQISKRVFGLSILLTLLPSFLVFGGGISRLDGVLLLFMFAMYLFLFSHDSGSLKRLAIHVPFRAQYFKEAYLSFIGLSWALPILFLSSIFIVLFSAGISRELSIPPIFFGIVILGVITTLPELFLGLRGAVLQNPSLALENILAGAVFNGTVVLGVLSIISPTEGKLAYAGPVLFNAIFMAVAFIFLAIFSYTNSRISRTEGVLLMSIYLLFFVSALFRL